MLVNPFTSGPVVRATPEALARAARQIARFDIKALDAHGRQRPVSVHGRLARAGRTYTLEDPRGLNVIE